MSENIHREPSPPFPALWTVREVMAFLQASRSWVYKAAESGALPSIRIGGLLRFNPEEVRRHVQRGARTATVLRLP